MASKFLKDKVMELFHKHPLVASIIGIFVALLVPTLTSDYDTVNKVFSVLSNATFLGTVLLIISIILMLTVSGKERETVILLKRGAVELLAVAVFMFLAVECLLSIYGPMNLFLAFLTIICWSFILAVIMHVIFYLSYEKEEVVFSFIWSALLVMGAAAVFIPYNLLLNYNNTNYNSTW